MGQDQPSLVKGFGQQSQDHRDVAINGYLESLGKRQADLTRLLPTLALKRPSTQEQQVSCHQPTEEPQEPATH